MESYPWFLSAKRVLETVFPGDKTHYRLADLGCLEGGYAVEFARMGFQVLGVEVRESNITACEYVKNNTNLPNLTFVQDDARNISRYGTFDAVFCCGLFYHLDRPLHFLETLSKVTSKLLILQTHFAHASTLADHVPTLLRNLLAPLLKRRSTTAKFRLSGSTEHESLLGRWYEEYRDDADFHGQALAKWASWDNRHSFWIQREHLLQAILDSGFDLVMEQFDSLGPHLAHAMTSGYYRTESRGTFIGIKTGNGR
jgi:hypothetical protein